MSQTEGNGQPTSINGTGNPIVRIRPLPPRLRSHSVHRHRVEERLRCTSTLPITVVKADIGYDKSTAAADYRYCTARPACWYSLAELDADPFVWLTHIIHALRSIFPTCGDHAPALIRQSGGTTEHEAAVVDTLINDLPDHLAGETVLVLDDYHLIEGSQINPSGECCIGHTSPASHPVLVTRHIPTCGDKLACALTASGPRSPPAWHSP